MVEAYATWGLPAGARRRLADAVTAAALEYGVGADVDADALKLRGGHNAREPELRNAAIPTPRDETIWSGEMRNASDGEVECVVCGRRASPSEMESFGEDGEAISWYCRDPDGCAERAAAERATLDETQR